VTGPSGGFNAAFVPFRSEPAPRLCDFRLSQSRFLLMDVLQHLREATRSQHESIEARVDVLRPDLTRAEYRRLLERFYGFYVPLEAALAGAADWERLGFAFHERRKVSHLERDLLCLGLTPTGLRALPRCSELPSAAGLPAALGSLYVVEGATLGGQLIARHVKPRLGLADAAGCAFFTSYGADVGRNWRALGEFLRAQLRTGADVERAAGAAGDTFAKLGSWLARGQERHDGT